MNELPYIEWVRELEYTLMIYIAQANREFEPGSEEHEASLDTCAGLLATLGLKNPAFDPADRNRLLQMIDRERV